MTVVRAAAVQISPVLYSRDGTVEKFVAKIAELGRRGVQFATSRRRSCRTTRTSRLCSARSRSAPNTSACSTRP